MKPELMLMYMNTSPQKTLQVAIDAATQLGNAKGGKQQIYRD